MLKRQAGKELNGLTNSLGPDEICCEIKSAGMEIQYNLKILTCDHLRIDNHTR